MPVLLSVGLPPINALATNKVQGALGTLSSVWNFFRSGHLNLGEIRWSILLTLVGSICGTLLVERVGNELLVELIPLLLIAIAIYFLLSPRLLSGHSTARLSAPYFALLAALPMGFYGGFFGPGTGSIFPFLFVVLAGIDLRKATAQTKVMVLTINGSSAVLFALHGHVMWELALIMGAAQAVGARLGSTLVIKQGAPLVQPFIVTVTLLLAVKLLFFP